MHLCFPVLRGSATFSGQPSDISILRTHGRPNESSVLLPIFVHHIIRFLSGQAEGFDKLCGLLTLRRACYSGKKWPPYPVGFGPWPWPRRVKPRPTVGGVYCGPLSFDCFHLPWRQLLRRCPPLPQPQYTGSCLVMAAVGDLKGCSTADSWQNAWFWAAAHEPGLWSS